jgi:hypothetical protein
MTAVKTAHRKDDYLTDGKRLVQVTGHLACGDLIVEDANGIPDKKGRVPEEFIPLTDVEKWTLVRRGE